LYTLPPRLSVSRASTSLGTGRTRTFGGELHTGGAYTQFALNNHNNQQPTKEMSNELVLVNKVEPRDAYHALAQASSGEQTRIPVRPIV
jgi:hypothetical protein